MASIPRCGSTYLCHAIAKQAGKPFKFVREFDNLPDVPVLKTHVAAPETLPPDVRAIFLFGDPIAAVLSMLKSRNKPKGWANCGYTSAMPPEIYERDDLGFERTFDSWTAGHSYPILSLRYETMFDYQDAISDFVGFDVRLPPWKPRRTQVSDEQREHLLGVYGLLDQKIFEAGDATIRTIVRYDVPPDRDVTIYPRPRDK